MTNITYSIWTKSLLFASLLAACSSTRGAELVDVRRIWDAAPHNAFTDLLWHDGAWWCVFREGAAHVSPDGALRVLTSPDGETWTSAALLTADDADLRDAKIAVAPDGRLMLAGAGAWHNPDEPRRGRATHQSFLWYSRDGRNWGEAIPIGEPNYWIWRVTWHMDVAYGVGYSVGEQKEVRLYRSADGRTFEPIAARLYAEGYPNEASLLFQEDGSCLCLLRRDDDDGAARLGVAAAPYAEWTWRNPGVRIGGPQLIELPSGDVVVAGRDYVGTARTKLWRLDVETGRLKELLTFPSGGDCSYPGLVWRDDLLWVSYYSSHDGKTSIYLARVKL